MVFVGKLTEPRRASSIPANGSNYFPRGRGIVLAILYETMKFKTYFGFFLVASAFAIGLWPGASLGQAGADDPLLTPLIEEITKQQAAILENQTLIEEKIAGVSEDVRVARIFVGRGGGKVTGK